MTQPDVSIVMPAYGATNTIGAAIKSVIAQTHSAWELLLVADDAIDYEALLKTEGISDRRLRFLSTGKIGTGSPPARNLGIEHANARYLAILDADDLFAPQKLELCLQALQRWPIISSALDIATAAGKNLRTVGTGPSGALAAASYKFVNISMDSMLVYDRRAADPRFDPALPCLTDLDFVLKLFAGSGRCYHFGTPLHTYVKQPLSISNKPGASAVMIKTKNLLRQRLLDGEYILADPEGSAGFIDFLTRSLEAETQFETARAKDPTLLFESHLERFLPDPAVTPLRIAPQGFF